MSAIDWKRVQSRLGVAADGIRGRGTIRALLGTVASPQASPAVLTSLANAMLVHSERYRFIDDAVRLADITAQTANETGGYVRFEEDLRYRAAAMLAQWPTHFTPAQAAAAVGKPVEIASRAYGGRMGNAPYPSTDGYDYRGRGMLQLTGRAAYAAMDRKLGLGLDVSPELAAVPALSLLIALQFYTDNGVWAALDAGDTDGARRITNVGNRYAKDNGGKLIVPIGLTEVNRLRQKLLAVLVG